MKRENVTAGLAALAAAGMLLCVKVIAPVCSGMLETAAGKQVPMKCHYTSQALVLISILLLINAVVCLVTKQGLACGIMGIALALAAFAVFYDNIGIGICVKPEMACHATAPLVKVCATIEILVSAVMIKTDNRISGVKHENR